MIEHVIRNKYDERISVKLNPQRAIKAWCSECMGWETDPNTCDMKICPLWPWKGKLMRTYRPADWKPPEMSEERRQKSIEALRKAREERK